MVKTGRNLLAVSVLMVAVILLSGCGGITIQNTSGIKKYLITQARCELLAIRMKKDYKDFIESPQYRQIEISYNTAAAYGNGYIADIIVQVKTSHIVNVSEEAFTGSDVYAKMKEFLTWEAFTPIKEAPEKPKPSLGNLWPHGRAQNLGISLSDLDLVESAITKAVGIFTSLQDRADKETDAQLKILEQEWFSRVYWNSFDRTTEDSFNMKWTRSFQPTVTIPSTKEADQSK